MANDRPSRPKRLVAIMAAAAVFVVVSAVHAQGPTSRPAPATGSTADTAAPLTIEQCAAEEKALSKKLRQDYPEGDTYWLFLAQTHRGQGDPERAAESWQRALRVNPRCAEAYRELGQLAHDMGESKPAIAYWRKALEIKPGWLLLRMQIADERMELGELRAALDELVEHAGDGPQNAAWCYIRAEGHLRLDEHEQARQWYENAIAIDPQHTASYFGLFNTCIRLGLKDQAKIHMATFRKLKDESTKVIRARAALPEQRRVRERLAGRYIAAGLLYQTNGNGSGAEAAFKRAVEVVPDARPPHERLALLYQGAGKLPQALEQYKLLSEIVPNDPFPYMMAGIIYTQMRQFAPSESAFEKVIELAPKKDLGYIHLVRLYLIAGAKLPKAQELAKQAVELNGSAQNNFYWGWASYRNGDMQAARKGLEMAVKLAPDNEDYSKRLAKIKSELDTRSQP